MSEGNDNFASAEKGPGSIIRYAREQFKLSQDELAVELKISRNKLLHIEHNQYEQVGTETFVRGYLRNAARVLKLDSDMLLQEYELFMGSNNRSLSSAKEAAEDPTSKKSNWLLWLFGALLLLAIWAAFSLFLSDEGRTTAQVQNPISMPVSAKATSSKTLDADSPIQQNSDEASATELAAQITKSVRAGSSLPGSIEGGQKDEAVLDEGGTVSVKETVSLSPEPALADAAPDTPIAEPAIAQSTPGTRALKFYFKEDCWIQVRDSTGRRLFSNTKKSGEVLAIEGVSPFRINIGNVKAVRLDVDGEAFPLIAESGRKTLQLTLP